MMHNLEEMKQNQTLKGSYTYRNLRQDVDMFIVKSDQRIISPYNVNTVR